MKNRYYISSALSFANQLVSGAISAITVSIREGPTYYNGDCQVLSAWFPTLKSASCLTGFVGRSDRQQKQGNLRLQESTRL